MALSVEELKQIRARANSATPGPWKVDRGDPTDNDMQSETWYQVNSEVSFEVCEILTYERINEPMWSTSLDAADADFIAHAREDIPALLDEVERLRTALKLIDNNTCEDGHLFIGGNPFDVPWDDLKCTRCGFRFVETRLK